jgi:integrase
LHSNALDDLIEEARALIYIMADTGARVVEVTGLMADDIRLDAPIPYIHIRSNKRGGLKTGDSDRQIPLVGAALYGAKMIPKGMERYTNADSVSTLINKYLRHHDLSTSEGQSLYSLRHTFKDRLRDAQAPEEIIDNLMGHRSRGPKYGRGHILETKREWLQKIAFLPPNKSLT